MAENTSLKTKKTRNQAVRKAAILDLLESNPMIRVADLSSALNVSVVTVRSDLKELEAEGSLRRVHGAAVANKKIQYGDALERRRSFKSEEKRRIARAAAQLIKEGDSLIINVGSTCAYICEELKNKQNLIVITNALHILTELSSNSSITLFFLGGHFNNNMQITIGEDVIDQLSKYKVDKLIMGMDGVDLEAGLTSYNHMEDAIMREMIAKAHQRILVADDSKIGKVTFAHIAGLQDFDVLVTNYTEENKEILEKIRKTGMQVITV